MRIETTRDPIDEDFDRLMTMTDDQILKPQTTIDLPELPPGFRYQYVCISYPAKMWDHPEGRDLLHIGFGTGPIKESIMTAIEKLRHDRGI